jgi:hypothetical protein
LISIGNGFGLIKVGIISFVSIYFVEFEDLLVDDLSIELNIKFVAVQSNSSSVKLEGSFSSFGFFHFGSPSKFFIH